MIDWRIKDRNGDAVVEQMYLNHQIVCGNFRYCYAIVGTYPERDNAAKIRQFAVKENGEVITKCTDYMGFYVPYKDVWRLYPKRKYCEAWSDKTQMTTFSLNPWFVEDARQLHWEELPENINLEDYLNGKVKIPFGRSIVGNLRQYV